MRLFNGRTARYTIFLMARPLSVTLSLFLSITLRRFGGRVVGRGSYPLEVKLLRLGSSRKIKGVGGGYKGARGGGKKGGGGGGRFPGKRKRHFG